GQCEAVTFTPSDITDYTTTSSTVTVNVGQATPTVSVNPVNITYGTTLANGQLTGSAIWTVNGSRVTVPGTFTYTSAAGTVLNASASGQSEAVTFTPSATTDYTTASSTVTVNVAQATPAVSVNPVNITYGTALANGQLSGSAIWTVNGSRVTVPGTFTYTSAAGTVLNASASGQSEAVTFTPSATTDYTSASSTVTVNVAQDTPVVSVNPVNITYGTALANGQLSGSAIWTVNGSRVTVPGTFTYTSAAGTVLNAGHSGQSEAVTFTPADTTDYTTASSTAMINVNLATLFITAISATRVYGQPNPPLTVHYYGFVNGDTSASLTAPVALSTPAVLASFAGPYPIIVGGAASPNYAIRFVSGTLTITPPTNPTVLGRIAFVTS